MKGQLKHSLIASHYELLSHQPLSEPVYVLLTLVPSLVVMTLPVQLLSQPTTEPYFQTVYKHSYPSTINLLLGAITCYLCITLITYLSFLFLVGVIKKKKELDFSSQVHKYLLAKLIMILLHIERTVVSLPCKIFGIIVIKKAFIDNEDENTATMILGIANLSIDLSLTVVYNLCLTCIFPLGHIPWASMKNASVILLELTNFAQALSLSMGYRFSTSPYINLVTLSFNFLIAMMGSNYHSNLSNTILMLSNSLNISSFTVLTLLSITKKDEDFKMIGVYITLFLALFALTYYYHRRRELNISSKAVIKDRGQKEQWVQSLVHFLQKQGLNFSKNLFEKSSPEKVLRIVLEVQAILKAHIEECKLAECNCGQNRVLDLVLHLESDLQCTDAISVMFNPNDMVLSQGLNPLFTFNLAQNPSSLTALSLCCNLLSLLTDIFLSSSSSLRSSSDSSLEVNSNLAMVKLFFELYFEDKPYYAMYLAQKSHDCRRCSYQQCANNYCLKRLIEDGFHAKSRKRNSPEKSVEKEIWRQFYIYEKQARKVFTTCSLLTETISSFWSCLLRQEVDLFSAESFGASLVSQYAHFQRLRALISANCSDFHQVDQLSWRFHSQVLNFELESWQEFEKYQQKVQKTKVRSSYEEQTIDPKQGLLVVSLEPLNYTDIQIVSKNLCQMVGYSEGTLKKSKMRILLPLVVDQVHHVYLERFMKKEASLQQSMHEHSQPVFVCTKQGSIRAVQISIMPIIHYSLTPQFICLIKELHHMPFYSCTLPFSNLFFVLADSFNRILHFSTTFIQKFKLKEHALRKNVQVEQVILNLPLELHRINEDELYMMTLKDLVEDGERRILDEVWKVALKVEVRTYENEEVRIYYFTPQVLHQNSSSSMQNLSISFNQANSNEAKSLKLTDNASSSSGQGDNPAMLSASESSTSMSDIKECLEINEIKGTEGLQKKLKIITRLRVYLVVCLIAWICLTSTYFSINKNIENDYIKMLENISSVKSIKGCLAYTSLFATNLMILANLPESYNTSKLDPNFSYGISYYNVTILATDSILQDSISNFTMLARQWSERFTNYVNKEHFYVLDLTMDGHFLGEEVSFKKGLNLFSQRSLVFASRDITQYKVGWDLIQQNNTEFLKEVVENSSDLSRKSLLRSMFFITYNASRKIFDSLFSMDTYYMDGIHEQQGKFGNWAIIISVVSVSSIVLLGISIIPTFLKVQQQKQILMEVLLAINSEELRTIFHNIQIFEDIIGMNSGDYPRQNRPEASQNNNQQNYNSSFAAIDSSMTMLNNNKRSQATAQQTRITTTGKKGAGGKGRNKMMVKEGQEEKKLEKGLKRAKGKGMFEEDKEEEKEEEEIGAKFSMVTIQNQEKLLANKKPAIIKSQVRTRKIQVVSAIFLACFCLSVYFGIIYYLQEKLNLEIQEGFVYLDVFFQTSPCLYYSYFLYQTALLYNLSLDTSTEYGERFDSLNVVCNENEINYMELQQKSSGIFSQMETILEKLDSGKTHCNYTIEQGWTKLPNCYENLGGAMMLGLKQADKVFRSKLQQKVVYYQAIPPQDRTVELLSAEIFDDQILNYAMGISLHSGPVYYNLQPVAISEFRNSILSKSRIFLFCFLLSLSVIVVLEVLLQVFYVRSVQHQIWSIKMILKLVPAQVLLKQKKVEEKLKGRKIYNIE